MDVFIRNGFMVMTFKDRNVQGMVARVKDPYYLRTGKKER